MTPDLLVLGTIHTLDPARPRAEALLARHGRVLELGSAAACRAAAAPGARVLDLAGGSAVPGLADAHGHVLLHARSLEEVKLSGARDEAACAALAAERARALPPGSWVRGRGWDQNRWPGGAFPGLAALDAAVPDHPVLLERVDGHMAWVNGRALALAGIGPGTADPPGGRIARDERGRPTGLLVDAAQDLVHGRIPHPSAREVERLLRLGLADLVRLGLTAVHDAGCTSSVLRCYAGLADGDALPLRVYAMIDGGQPEGALRAELARWSATPAIGRLDVRAVKLFADGALGSRGAALLDGYADDPGNRGLFLTPPQALRARLELVAGGGFQPAVHAIGDAACREVIAALVELGREHDLSRLRPRVEHLQLARAEDLDHMREACAVASMQPLHAVSDAPWVAARLGGSSPALAGAYAWRQVLARGIPLALGSDFPVESPDPRLGLRAAELRRPAGAAEPWHPAERLTRLEALHGFTWGPAFASFAEGRRGVLQPGADADLTAFGGDVLEVPAERLGQLPVVATVVGGRVEHGRVS
ncbi:amidohydrolase [Anaeromyxobacter diazotrophicus]|uniref:Amidohydrolase n=1 Tax=Anaeromyxobacter diazotrophicus TaxID=2590199 RepID=A0A7I9VMI6_9BACT|nr:amidohydrolase [Anaeromyxobacter diazotrophicus]GEJ57350.1 amidohydrolase [Anaeromyxobacter diazotrophicus]